VRPMPRHLVRRRGNLSESPAFLGNPRTSPRARMGPHIPTSQKRISQGMCLIPMGSTLSLVRTTFERRIELDQTSWIIHRGCATRPTRAWGLYRMRVLTVVTGMNAE
jgi:hypothetical protein